LPVVTWANDSDYSSLYLGEGANEVILPSEMQETTHETNLPIDIAAIGRGEQAHITLSLRFIDFDLFSANSHRINEAMSEQLRLSRSTLEDGLFESFEVTQALDINEQVAHYAVNLNLFAEPASFGRIGQVDIGDEIPLWIIISVLSVCAVLGYIIARAVVSKKKEKAI